jgi:sugar (pentulose or hexulose) kinase
MATSIELVLADEDHTEHIYITGGFARNRWFTALMAHAFPEKQVFASRVDNASSLGAAMILSKQIWSEGTGFPDLGLVSLSPLT